MEGVINGKAKEDHHHHHEVELSVWPLVVAVGAFLVPMAFMLAYSWGVRFLGLLVAGVAVGTLVVGLFGWVQEVHSKKQDGGLSKIAIMVFIVSEVALFGGLFGGYLYTMLPEDIWPPASTPAGIPPLALAVLLSVFLLSSSGTMHMAEEKIEHGDLNGYKSWLIFTFILGGLFIAFMGLEWYKLISEEHFSISTNAYGTFFFTITGFHGSHVIVGLIMQLFLVILASQNRIGKKKLTFSKAAGLYWHFVDVVWLLVFSLMYVVPYFKVGQ
ncbi:MAG: heme-copper oxidase subunit III [Nitrospirae bacterium]|nr:heme-copper oxidase subunit III [Nitrospirota bacterium]MBF0592454.1 heme-copper oxidase subunit III [Nitrospirota bacterium]